MEGIHLEHNQEFQDCVLVADWTVIPASQVTQQRPFPHTAQATLVLPVSSELLYFLSRGPLSRGSISYVVGEESSDVVDVRVEVSYTSPDVLHLMKVCLLQRDEVNNGVGIYVSLHPVVLSGGTRRL